MVIIRLLFFLYLFFFIFTNTFAFTKQGKGTQSTGREDLSFLEAKNSNFKKGKDALKQALKLKKKNKFQKSNKRLNDSIKYFVEAYKENPNNVEVYNYLGLTYNYLGDFMMSEIYYREGLSIEPKNNLLNFRLGVLYSKTKRIDQAKERLDILGACNCEEYLDLKKIIIDSK
tara:strand:+ start:500 stop:1015 length:516 start_codon:yes stop_codon:yes gene_type:complete